MFVLESDLGGGGRFRSFTKNQPLNRFQDLVVMLWCCIPKEIWIRAKNLKDGVYIQSEKMVAIWEFGLEDLLLVYSTTDMNLKIWLANFRGRF